MKEANWILVHELCTVYKVEISFFDSIENFGFFEIKTISDEKYIHQKNIKRLEKILRLHRDLDINLEGIDVILILQKRLEKLEKKLQDLQNQISLYES